MRIASIDIGTNTVLMVIADIENNNINVIDQYFDIARLGEGVDSSKLINEEAITRLIKILENFKNICDNNNVEKIFAVGTSALRDAKNKIDILDKIKNVTGILIKIISGELEAEMSFKGAVEKPGKSLLIDIGGGSTEIIVGDLNNIEFMKSINIGAVRITEKFFSEQPPTLCDMKKAQDFIESNLINLPDFEKVENYYGTAGTVTTIAATSINTTDDNIKAYEGLNLTYDDMNQVFKNFANSSTEEIIDKYKVHPKRADLITAGALILKLIYKRFNIKNIIVSSKGLRFGVIKNYKHIF